jgi:polysaccharide export outer membrane protein
MASKRLLSLVVAVLAGATALGAQQPTQTQDVSRVGQSRTTGTATGVDTPAADGSHGALLAPRDSLNITTANEPGFSAKVIIDADGTFDFPFLGRIKAAGMTPRALENDLRTRLAGTYITNPQITVEVTQAASKRVFMAGRVRNPSQFPFSGKVTLFEALTAVGGPADDAGDRAYIVRGNPDGSVPSAEQMKDVTKIYVDLQKLSEGDLSQNYTLNDGDYIYVERAEPFTITGEVKTPNQYPVRKGLTVQQAVALAGGLTDRAKSNGNGIKILRPSKDPKKPFDVKDWKTEIVKPGDTITVPSRVM